MAARNRRPWWVLLAALLYVALPFDLVPEALLPVLGWIDDAGVLGAAVTWWIRSRRRGALSKGGHAADSS